MAVIAMTRDIRARGSEVAVGGDAFFIERLTTDEQLIVEAVRCAQGIEGVTAVAWQIRHVAFVSHVH